jgi:hypothetical protein
MLLFLLLGYFALSIINQLAQSKQLKRDEESIEQQDKRTRR